MLHAEFTKYSNDEVRRNEMEGTCFTYKGEERCIQGFGGATCWEKKTLGRPTCVREDNIKTDLQKSWKGSTDWVHLSQDGDRWRALVNAVMNCQVP
jgi:hypothetical protein